MYRQDEAIHPGELLRLPALLVVRNTIVLLVVIALLGADFPLSSELQALPGTSEAIATNGAALWVGDQKITRPTFDFPAPASQAMQISPLFTSYYARHHGAQSLGTAATVAFPGTRGWLQFFASGALLLPSIQQEQALRSSTDFPLALSDAGARDPHTGVVRLPLLQALLTVGSQVPVGGNGSSLTYADLRSATSPDHLLPAPTTYHTAALSRTLGHGIFIKGGTRQGMEVGHLIPQPLWNYITRTDVSPDGWEKDFGPPLTEALSFSVTEHGRVHQMVVQAFWRDGVIFDQSTLDARGQPQIQRLDTGLAYLRTFGLPAIALHAQHSVWAQGEAKLLAGPATGRVIAHIGLDFPLTLLGDTMWRSGMLWYHVAWTAPKHRGIAWVQASSITFTSPGIVPGWASFDLLSPALSAYLAHPGGNVAAAVFDVTRQRYYTSQTTAQFLTGSSIKVPIMLAFLDMTEREGRQPTAYEMNLLTTMIENSNNDSAEMLYNSEIGDAPGLAHYLQRIGITDLDPYPYSFGWSMITPLAMVKLLLDLYQGTILTARDRQLALSLMEHIEPDQQVGVGDTAPGGATVAMKDGWVPGPDGLWAMNSSGIVTVGRETYIIAVYTQEQNGLGDGQAIVRQVCRSVAALLT